MMSNSWAKAHPERHRAHKAAWRARNIERAREMDRNAPSNAPPARRRAWLKYKYGISPEEFDALFLLQEGRCGICRVELTLGSKRTTRPYIDHDHVTGAVRGILCLNCNMGLGYFQDDPICISRAAAWVGRK
jgi:hypothetical protein